jgi:hypothetical protein
MNVCNDLVKFGNFNDKVKGLKYPDLLNFNGWVEKGTILTDFYPVNTGNNPYPRIKIIA